MRIVTVLRSGGDFKPVHVQALKKQCEQYAPFANFECLSDRRVEGVKVTPLKTDWPRWWAKMELFSPDLRGDFLFLDLDTVIVGDLLDVLLVDKLTLLRDFYRDGVKLKAGLGSGVMFLPEAARTAVWDRFAVQKDNGPGLPGRMMQQFSKGDQQFLEYVWGTDINTWQAAVPSQVISYKVHCCQSVLGQKLPRFVSVPSTARVICFHGQPRPWDVPQFEGLYK